MIYLNNSDVDCEDCINKCDERNRILCYLENKFIWTDDFDLRRRLVRAIYAFEANLQHDIFREDFMSRADEEELVEIKSIISAEYRKELMSMSKK